MRLHAQAKARGAIDYIKNTYFGKEKENGEGSEFMMGGGGNGGKSQIKKYNEKLHLIKDEPSREKIRKEIERFSQLDRHASDFHKIQTYLDDVFSIPWE
jgi:Lon-like ATP-dependent protease